MLADTARIGGSGARGLTVPLNSRYFVARAFGGSVRR